MAKNKKKDIIFIIIFVLIVGIAFFYLFQTSLGKYRKQTKGNVESGVAGWNIKVNNESIANKSTLENTIVPTFDPNQYVKANVLAPGSTGHFDVNIDASEVDVDFTYEIIGVPDPDAPLDDLIITGYEVNHSGTIIPYTDADPVSGQILKNTASTLITLYFEWYEGAGEAMDNIDDTQYAINQNSTLMKLTINFNQKRAVTP